MDARLETTMTSPTEGPVTENGTLQFADERRSPMIDRRTVGGVALSVGGILFFVLWIGEISASGFLSDLEPFILHLLFFGTTTVAVASGIWITTRFLSTDRNRLMMTIGAVMAMAGVAVNLAVWALGVAVMGVSYCLDRRLRWIGAALAVGGSMWLVVLALGARWGSVGDVPLAGVELGLAAGGLSLIAGGLTASGVVTLRQRR